MHYYFASSDTKLGYDNCECSLWWRAVSEQSNENDASYYHQNS